ncbi:MAG: bifunctional 5,10-methylenetetrahydrofolate dehydrogenase/5,10-methenyltetrahydrofolate cyclohydrolase, partial [Holosporaceae bacterium]
PSALYVARKRQTAEKLGFFFREAHLKAEAKASDILSVIQKNNDDPAIHGIILQLPLPQGLEADDFLKAISPFKDVDGLHPLNRGMLYSPNGDGFVPCTPWGCLELLKAYDISIKGKHVVVIGRSVLVGRPLAALFLRCDATVSLAHRHTVNLEKLAQSADILCVAAGQQKLINQAFVHSNSVVVDVGIHKTATDICGDVDFKNVAAKVKAITPVPGGVGPLTVMGLMHNTLKAAFLQCKHSFLW